MKLRYFLRGIGMGVILTTIILTVSHCSNRKMSDNEIIERARELGMTFGTPLEATTSAPETSSSPGKSDTDNEKTTEAGKESETSTPEKETPKENAATEPPLTTEAPPATTEPPATEAPPETEPPATEAPPETEPPATEAPPATTEPPATEAPPETEPPATEAPSETEPPATEAPPETASPEQAGDVITYMLVISHGMSSNMVCSVLQENGIITNAAEFDRFLINNGYAERIRVGSFEVRSSMSYEELAAVFCSR